MIHGLCGTFNPNSPCMIDGKCSKRYPRALISNTLTGTDGYPLHRRRSAKEGGSDVTVFGMQQQETNDKNAVMHVDEVAQYQAGRYISSNEAVWRILSLPIHEQSPAVVHLAVHLENGERVYFTAKNVQQIALNPPATTLNAFFYIISK
ncbi:ATP-dependent DNA helicase [Trichonephila clavipes]|nr:ATP-dependent DNA helicase [Trichonephila clavipes]